MLLLQTNKKPTKINIYRLEEAIENFLEYVFNVVL